LGNIYKSLGGLNMDFNIVVGLSYNVSLLIALTLLYTNFVIGREKDQIKYKIFYGILIGLMGIGVMANPIRIVPGGYLDGRIIVIGISALFFGKIPTLTAVVITSLFRIYEGGAGMTAGVVFIVITSLVGIYWRKKYLGEIIDKNMTYAAVSLFSLSLILSSAMLLSIGFLMEQGNEILRIITLPIFIVIPAGIVIIGLIIKNKIEEVKKEERYKNLLKEGDARYTSLFTNNHISTLIINPKNGNIIDANPAACKYYGYDLEGFKKMKISDINIFSKEEIKKEMDRAKSQEKNHFEVKHKLKDGTIKDVEVYSGPIKLSNSEYLYSMIFDITQRKEKQEKIEYLSYYDQLTGLYNRRFFEVEMKRLDSKRNIPISLVMADVNGLKLINDAFGHKFGDELLVKAAEALKEVCRKEDIVSRVGGDEFVILLPKTDKETSKEIVERINKNIKNIKIKGLDMSISFGVGTKAKEEKSLEEVYTEAENRMYKNKLFTSSSIKGNMGGTILNTIYQSNPREKNHFSQVSKLCEDMAEALELNDEIKTDLKVSGLLHDIGKVALDKRILNKVEELSEKDWEEIKNHSDIGYRILSSVNNLSSIAEYVLYHHERWDGEGYPKGLKGHEIPYISRIIAVCDAYDAMTRKEPYGPPLSKEEAIKEIKDNSGTQFDPKIASAFVRLIEKTKVKA
jgi:diguanylate cyclase (GGDEF)-like protein/PAS domain S-box-containing protein